MIVVTVFVSILNQMEIHLVKNRKVFKGVLNWASMKPKVISGRNFRYKFWIEISQFGCRDVWAVAADLKLTNCRGIFCSPVTISAEFHAEIQRDSLIIHWQFMLNWLRWIWPNLRRSQGSSLTIFTLPRQFMYRIFAEFLYRIFAVPRQFLNR